MEARSNPRELKVNIPTFSGGMNTSVKRRDLADDEALSIENMEFDETGDLITRNGVTADGTARGSTISSVYVFNTESGFVGILNSFGASLSSRPLVLGAETDLSGGLPGGIPNNTRWYWKQLDNTAVGVMNGPTVKVVGGAPGTASALAAAPNGKYIEEWRSRLWIVHSANPNRLQCSDLGSATAWNTDGLTNAAHGIVFDVAAGDGDVITGLFAFKERLFIFKRKKIYVLRITAIPETDPNSWEVVEYSKIIGCVNQTTIREVFDDVLFLSEAGICSLAASEMAADFASALVSQKIDVIQRIKQNATELDIFGFTLPDKSQYWLALKNNAHPNGSNIIYVLDYKNIREGKLRWTQFDTIVPSAMDAYNIGQTRIVYVFGNTSNKIGQYVPTVPAASRTFNDVLSAVSLTIGHGVSTKTYTMGYPDLRKYFDKWYLVVELPKPGVNNIDLNVSYNIYPLTAETSGIAYPTIAIDSIANYDALRYIRRALKWDKTRKGWSIDFIFSQITSGQGMIIRDFGLVAELLSDPMSEDRLT